MQSYLYTFSLVKLRRFASDPNALCLFRYYFERYAVHRIFHSETMRKNFNAYIEAGEKILACLNQGLADFDLYKMSRTLRTNNRKEPVLKLPIINNADLIIP